MIHGSDPEQRQAFADFLSALALSLFGVFAVTAVASAVPLQVLNPGWQLRLSSSLIDNGPIACLGLLAAWLAAVLAPASAPHANRLRGIRRWAILAALGYLLLIPLQGTAAWLGLSQAFMAERQEERVLVGRLASLRQLVRSAPSIAALQASWLAAQGPALSTADLAVPLPQLRSQLLLRLQQLNDRFEASGRSQASRARVWSVVQNTLRLCLSALFLGLGFAAAGQDRSGNPSLLQHWHRLWLHALQGLGGRRIQTRWGQGRMERKRFEDAEYFDQISPRE